MTPFILVCGVMWVCVIMNYFTVECRDDGTVIRRNLNIDEESINVVFHQSFPSAPTNYKEIVYGNGTLLPPNWECFHHGFFQFQNGTQGAIALKTCGRHNDAMSHITLIGNENHIFHRQLSGEEFDDDTIEIVTASMLTTTTTETITTATSTITLTTDDIVSIDSEGLSNPDLSWIMNRSSFADVDPIIENIESLSSVIERRYFPIDLVHDKKRCDALGLNEAADNGLSVIHTTSLMYGYRAVDSGLDFDLKLYVSSQFFMNDENFWDGLGLVDYNSNDQPYGIDMIQELAVWVANTNPNRHNFHYENSEILIPEIMLLTHENLQGSTVGLNYLGTTCHPRYRVGLTETRSNNFAMIVIIVSHELGHGLDMAHDGSGNSCSSSQFIMAPYVSSDLSKRFSSCSTSSANSYFHSGGLFCLETESPFLEPSVSVCGDGIIMFPETCDTFGISDHCCNATTCQLIGNASCSPINHACCDNQCQPLSFDPLSENNTLCRAQRNDCDVPEYCHGNPNCPDDVSRPNGTQCISSIWETDDGVCYKGDCVSGNDVCYQMAKRYGYGLYLDGGCMNHDCQAIQCKANSNINCLLFSTDHLEPDGMSCNMGEGEGQCVNQNCVNLSEIIVPVCGDGIVTPPEKCDCGSGNCNNGCDPRTCEFIVDRFLFIDLDFEYDDVEDIGDWIIGNNTEFRMRYNLDSLLLRTIDVSQKNNPGQLEYVLDKSNAYPHFNISIDGFTKNMKTYNEKCVVLFDNEIVYEMNRDQSNNPLIANYIINPSSLQTQTENHILQIQSIVDSYWHTCFIRKIHVEGLSEYNAPIYNWTNMELDFITGTWSLFQDNDNWFWDKDNDLLQFWVSDISISDTLYWLYPISVRDFQKVQVNITIQGTSWESDEYCLVKLSRNHGQTYDVLVETYIENDLANGFMELDVGFYDTITLLLQFVPNGKYDYCNILNISINYV